MKTTLLKAAILFIFTAVYTSLSAQNYQNFYLNNSSGTINYVRNHFDIYTWHINTGVSKPVKITYALDLGSIESDWIEGIEIQSLDDNGNVVQTEILGGQASGTMRTSTISGKAKITITTVPEYVYSGNASVGFQASYSVDDSYVDSPISGIYHFEDKIGIGTASPKEKLHINGAIRGSEQGGALKIKTEYGYIDIGPQSSTSANIYTDRNYFLLNKPLRVMVGEIGSSGTTLFLKTGNNTRMTILNNNGNVGIGTTAPAYPLDVKGTARISGDIYGADKLTFQDDARFTVTPDNLPGLLTSSYSMPYYGIAAPGMGGSAGLCLSGNHSIHLFTSGSPNPRMSISTSGNVGIGTSNPQHLLDVKGTIRATEVLVQSVDQFADFVFDKDYRLPGLNEVQSFIRDNGHLPGIPSAQEVKENGMSLVEMQVKLLQKIEELTLYVIEQHEIIDRQNAKIEVLEQRVK